MRNLWEALFVYGFCIILSFGLIRGNLVQNMVLKAMPSDVNSRSFGVVGSNKG